MARIVVPSVFRTGAVAGALFFLVSLLVGTAGVASEKPDPQVLVDRTIETLRETVVRDAALIESDPRHALMIAEHTIAPHIDMVLASRLVLGKHWHEATDTQREAFVESLSGLLMRIFALYMRDYTDAAVEYEPTQFMGESGQRALVRTRVSRGGGTPLSVDYRMHRSLDGWKVYDVKIFGISLVRTYHISVDNDVDRVGLDEVIEQINALFPLGGSDALPVVEAPSRG